MAKVRANSDAKWARRAGSATQEYQEGVQNPRSSWKSSTLAAEAAHKAGTEQALRDKRFARGVGASSDEKWQQKALVKGGQRFSSGVAEAQGDYAKGVAPYLAKLSTLQLPPRGPKGDPSNINRVVAVTKALRDVKLQQG